MNNRFSKILVLSFILLYSPVLKALETINLDQSKKQYNLERFLDFYEDEKGTVSFNKIRSPEFENSFKATNETLNFGYSQSVIWVRVKLRNPSSTEQNWLLQLENPLIDSVILFTPSATSRYERRLSGDTLPFSSRDLKHRSIIFHVKLKKSESKLVYLRFQTSGPFSLPLVLHNPISFQTKDHNEQGILGVFYGILVVMVFYNFFIYLVVRDRAYLYYVFFITTIMMALLYFTGTGFEFVWPNNPEWQRYGNIFSCLCFVSANLFTVSFLNVKRTSPRLNLLILVFNLLWGLIFILVFIVPQASITPFISVFFAPNIVFLLAIGIYCSISVSVVHIFL